MMREIIIENANENNLKNVSIRIPHYQLIAVTGVSGSGKTSLVFDVLCAEGKRLFYENFLTGNITSVRLNRPRAGNIEGLFPVIMIDQNSQVRNPRSTVGTLTELYDFLRLLFARLGKSGIPDLHPYRSLFSFNLPDGYCPLCKGLGVQDHIDPALLIEDASKSIRNGAFVMTTPNKYIVYSQVTMDVLDQVCRAEGFNVDIPWQDLSEYQKNIVLYGSQKIKVLFGKHPLESRLRWTGITAKPRDEDYYKGIIPVMEEILNRERNANILRFTRTQICEHCQGKRLNEKALSVRLWGADISEISRMSIGSLHSYFYELKPESAELNIVEPIREAILRRTSLLMKLGAGHLALDRESLSLSPGEVHHIRLASHAVSGLRNVLYVLDEPGMGLHSSEHRQLLEVLRTLVNNGNTVMLVDHDEQSICEADWIIDIGPGAGRDGGRIIYNGPAADFFSQSVPESITKKYLLKRKNFLLSSNHVEKIVLFYAENANKNNLKHISPHFLINAINVITGVSGSGKTSLVQFLVEDTLKQKNGGTDVFRKIIYLDSSPIGRTPNSNPATYTGLSDHVRDLLASTPESQQRGYKKGQFSFVVKGGRCEQCGGAGVQQIKMHFLGNVEAVCDSCGGKRFTEKTLEIKYKGLNIYDILELTVDEAHLFFKEQVKITSITGILSDLGLGYLKLGQPSTTLSGGEAQRIKLAAELSRSATGHTLYILDEPTTGLHMADVEILLGSLRKLVGKGHTLLCIEHDPLFILQSDWMVDLGPGSAAEGGNIVTQGFVKEMINHTESLTSSELRKYASRSLSLQRAAGNPCCKEKIETPIQLFGAETNNLKNIDVSFPADGITAVTGVSGSGKSSLVYGTLYAESQRRFLEGLSSYSRQFSVKAGIPVVREIHGLIPAVRLQKKNPVKNPRSTIATYTGLYDLYRLLFSRLSVSESGNIRPLSTAFSFNSEEGACPVCTGLGSVMLCNQDKLVSVPSKPLIAGALNGSRAGRFYSEPSGQYVAALLTVGKKSGIDFSVPYNELDENAKEIAMRGCGDEIFDVEWRYKRGTHTGIHKLKTTWPGFLKLVEAEYIRKHADARADELMDLMTEAKCSHCSGYRLKPEWLEFVLGGMHIGQLTDMTADDALIWFSYDFFRMFKDELSEKAAIVLQPAIIRHLFALQQVGLGYISASRTIGTLSGGEFQRLQLAGLVRSPLTGVAYVLDEPSFGLHSKDVRRISELIMNLNKHGNSIIMVEHAQILLNNAEHIIELGPGAGKEGGQLIYEGPGADFIDEKIFNLPAAYNISDQKPAINIINAHANNLRNINVSIWAGVMTVITGVSGSGKTSLLEKVIFSSFSVGKPVFCEKFYGFENFSDVVFIGQPGPGKGNHSTIGNKLGISEIIAKIFANCDESKKRGYKPSHFIMGSRDSRCTACDGTGTSQVAMDFFNDVVSPCERCGGTGFTDEVLEISIDGHTIYDVLQIPFNEIYLFFDAHLPGRSGFAVSNMLTILKKTGIEYLNSFRALNRMSTGELQRLKLVLGLSSKKGNKTLFLLDEPTGGLHPEDIIKIINLFNEIIMDGNTIVCVTHESLMVNAASKYIELGPGGGTRGGLIIGEY